VAQYTRNEKIRIGLINNKERYVGKIYRWKKNEEGNLKITIIQKNGRPLLIMGPRRTLHIEKVEK
jgi:hypothetical protein